MSSDLGAMASANMAARLSLENHNSGGGSGSSPTVSSTDLSSNEVATAFRSGGTGINSTIGSSSSKMLSFLENEGVSLGLSSIEEVARFPSAFEEDIVGSLFDGSHSPFGVSTGGLPDVSGSGNMELKNVGFADQTNAKLPKISSASEQQR